MSYFSKTFPFLKKEKDGKKGALLNEIWAATNCTVVDTITRFTGEKKRLKTIKKNS